MKLPCFLALFLPFAALAEQPENQTLANEAHQAIESLKPALEQPTAAHLEELVAFRKKFGALKNNADLNAVQKALQQVYAAEHKAYRDAELAARSERRTKGDPNAQALGLEWIHLPKGQFEMGDPKADADDSTAPVHTVSIEAFELTKTEITVDQYMKCVAQKGCAQPKKGTKFDGAYHCNWLFKDRGNYPMNCVSHSDAQKFAAWVGGRLPSEAEWEYAARNAGKTFYPWGDTLPNEEAQPDYFFDSNQAQIPMSAPVCQTPKGNTQNGICDMLGNLEEWVEDTYQSSYDATPTDGSAHVILPKKASKKKPIERVTRGRNADAFMRYPTDAIDFKTPDDPNGAWGIGFRVAR